MHGSDKFAARISAGWRILAAATSILCDRRVTTERSVDGTLLQRQVKKVHAVASPRRCRRLGDDGREPHGAAIGQAASCHIGR